MTVNNNLSKIISFVTSKGFQIHPDALFLIEKLKDDYSQIIEDILSDKRKKKEESMVIITDDIKNFVKDSSFTISTENNKNKLIVSGAGATAKSMINTVKIRKYQKNTRVYIQPKKIDFINTERKRRKVLKSSMIRTIKLIAGKE